MNKTIRLLYNNLFILTFSFYNIFFLIYIFILGYYNRLSGDDYAFMGHLREYGFFNPFTYWYDAWQGRFCPQFVINTVLLVYKIIPNLIFYTVIITTLFILSIYKILKLYFPLSKWYLLNYSVFLFSTLVFTALEFNTFFWITVSPMYYGGILFALFGVGYILGTGKKWHHFLIIGLSFIYVGSSSEHVGILTCGALGLLLLANSFKLKFNLKSMLSNTKNSKLLVAISFCAIAFVIMILAPGNKIRMAQSPQTTDIIHLIKITITASVFVMRHVFYKIPYLILMIPIMLLLGVFLKDKIIVKKHNYFIVLIISIIGLLGIIFLSNLPTAYAMSSNGPTRSYVFISFLILMTLSFLSVYTGYRFINSTRILKNISLVSIGVLILILSYVAVNEIPQSIKYSGSSDARIS